MPRYLITFEEDYTHKMKVEIDAEDEQEAYQKVYQSDYNVSDPVRDGDTLKSKRVYDNSAQLIMPINYRGPFL
jgi:hypothetical protein